jgi:hypothetical protein
MGYKITRRVNQRKSTERSIWGVMDTGEEFHVRRSNGWWCVIVGDVSWGRYRYMREVLHDLERGSCDTDLPWVGKG